MRELKTRTIGCGPMYVLRCEFSYILDVFAVFSTLLAFYGITGYDLRELEKTLILTSRPHWWFLISHSVSIF